MIQVTGITGDCNICLTPPLPDPLLMHVFGYCHGITLAKAQGTCRRWRRLTSDNDLWKTVLLRDFPNLKEKSATDAKKVYIANHNYYFNKPVETRTHAFITPFFSTAIKAWFTGGRFFSAYSKGGVSMLREVDPTSGGAVNTFSGVRPYSVKAKGERLVTIGFDSSVVVWNLKTAARLFQLPENGERTSQLKLTDKHFFTLEKVVKKWDLETGACARQFSDDKIYNFKVVDDRLFTVGKGVKMWKIETGECLRTFMHQVFSSALEVSGQKLFTGSAAKNVLMWDINTGDLLRTFSNNVYRPELMKVARDKLFFTTFACRVEIWDIKTGDFLESYSLNVDKIRQLKIFSRYLYVTAEDGNTFFVEFTKKFRPWSWIDTTSVVGWSAGRLVLGDRDRVKVIDYNRKEESPQPPSLFKRLKSLLN